MVGHELQTICPRGEDHHGDDREAGEEENGSNSNKGNGKNIGVSRSWTRIQTTPTMLVSTILTKVTNYILLVVKSRRGAEEIEDSLIIAMKVKKTPSSMTTLKATGRICRWCYGTKKKS